MADDELIGQDEIEKLLNQAKSDEPPAEPTQPAEPNADPEALGQDEIESLLNSGAGAPGDQTSAETQSKAGTAAATAGTESGSAVLGQDDIESLLGANKPPETSAPRQPAAAAAAAPAGGGEGVAQADVEYLLNQAQGALASIDDAGGPSDSLGISRYQFTDFASAAPNTEAATLDLIRDVELEVKIELGRTNMFLDEVLRLRKGSVVPLNKLAGDPVDIYVNGRLIARGEVLVLNDNFCVRVGELISGETAKAG